MNKKSFFAGGKFWKHPYFWSCSARGGFTFYSRFFILLTMKVTMRLLAVPKDCIN
jgi:hypothetical protein